jgi:urease accessory protein
MAVSAALLVLADGRLPAGGNAHSGGVESFVRRGELHDLDTLRSLLTTRLETVGFVDATIAAAVVLTARRGDVPWARIDAEAGARIASPALRTASRARGRQLLRAAQRMWPAMPLAEVEAVHPDGPHHAVALGAAGMAACAQPNEIAVAAVYGAIATPATAAVRLLGLDPLDVHSLLADVAPRVDAAAASAVACVERDGLAHVPAPSAPRSEFAAEEHAQQEVRLFAT